MQCLASAKAVIVHFQVSLSQIAVTSSAIMSGPQIHQTSIHWIIVLGGEMLESYYKLQPKLKTVPKLTDAF